MASNAFTAGGSIVLLSPHLNALDALFEIIARTLSQVQFNLYWDFAYNALALSLALGFWSPWGVGLSPYVAKFEEKNFLLIFLLIDSF